MGRIQADRRVNSLFRPKNNHGKRCFSYRASKLYNSVAERNELREVTMHAFKSTCSYAGATDVSR